MKNDTASRRKHQQTPLRRRRGAVYRRPGMPVRRKRATRGRPKTLDVQINVRVGADLDERLRKLAERTERSYADIVRRALTRGVEALEATPPPA